VPNQTLEESPEREKDGGGCFGSILIGNLNFNQWQGVGNHLHPFFLPIAVPSLFIPNSFWFTLIFIAFAFTFGNAYPFRYRFRYLDKLMLAAS